MIDGVTLLADALRADANDEPLSNRVLEALREALARHARTGEDLSLLLGLRGQRGSRSARGRLQIEAQRAALLKAYGLIGERLWERLEPEYLAEMAEYGLMDEADELIARAHILRPIPTRRRLQDGFTEFEQAATSGPLHCIAPITGLLGFCQQEGEQ